MVPPHLFFGPTAVLTGRPHAHSPLAHPVGALLLCPASPACDRLYRVEEIPKTVRARISGAGEVWRADCYYLLEPVGIFHWPGPCHPHLPRPWGTGGEDWGVAAQPTYTRE